MRKGRSIAGTPFHLHQPTNGQEPRSQQVHVAPNGQTVPITVRLTGFDSKEHHWCSPSTSHPDPCRSRRDALGQRIRFFPFARSDLKHASAILSPIHGGSKCGFKSHCASLQGEPIWCSLLIGPSKKGRFECSPNC
jgi:hypothetical protein